MGMELHFLTTISPVDGRYGSKTRTLAPYFSEMGLIQYRVRVEVEYFIALCQLGIAPLDQVNHAVFTDLQNLYTQFDKAAAQRIKEIESTTNHDVKAVEYFIKEHFDRLGLSAYKEFIHFGLTSQDINNTAIPLLLKEATQQELLPALRQSIEKLEQQAQQWQNLPMLARTHGQPASPTRLGKELMVFVGRLKRQLQSLEAVPYGAKFGGATGNFNAHKVAYPNTDWNAFANQWVHQGLGLVRTHPTTQIEPYDDMAAYCHAWVRINTILIDLCRDVWQYISMNYFTQKVVANEVGSSAMPHKVNPIDFENAEGNLGMANAMLEHLANKLPISRLQRDLTDSTVLRNIGVPAAHVFIALQSLQKGLGKLQVNEAALQADLEANWAVVAEAIQTILRREGYPAPYEALKALTRGKGAIDQAAIQQFIEGLEVSAAVKEELKAISPHNYTGYDA